MLTGGQHHLNPEKVGIYYSTCNLALCVFFQKFNSAVYILSLKLFLLF